MNFFTQYLSKFSSKLLVLQCLAIVRPFLGGFGFMLVIPLLSHIGLENAAPRAPLATLLQWLPDIHRYEDVLALIFTLLVAIAIFHYIEARLSTSLEQEVLLNLRQDLHNSVINEQWLQVSSLHATDYTRVITEDVEAVVTALDEVIRLISTFLLIIIYSLLCLALSPKLTALAAVVGLILFITTSYLQLLAGRVGDLQFRASESLHRKAGEQIRGLKTIKSHRIEDQLLVQFRKISKTLEGASRQYSMLNATAQLIHSCLGALAFCLLAWFAFDDPFINLPTLIVLALVFSRLLPKVTDLQTHFRRLRYLRPEILAVTEVLERSHQHQEHVDAGNEVDFSQGITINGMQFSYNKLELPVLNQFNARLEPRSLIAIKGPSGIGKTTLADLIAGLLIPDRGVISSGSNELSPATQRAWRRGIAYLPQEPFLIAGTIRENITMTLAQAPSENELMAALTKARADFMLKLPKGLETVLGEDGASLSAGERQRLLLARALLMKRPVLILDESTSQLDLANETVFLETLCQLKQDYLIIVISHRPGIVEIADKVIEIHESH